MPAALLLVAGGVTAAAFVPLLAERGEPARPGRKELGTLARESLAKAVLWATAPLGWGHGRPVRGQGDGTPVLIVSDVHHGRHALAGLAMFLRRRGHSYVYATRTGRGTLQQRAEELAHRVRALHQISGADTIHIVAHGVGGLIAGWYLRHIGAPVRVGRLVTLGTPWKGTRMAVFGRSALVRETQPGSSLLDDLAPTDPERLVCIWGSLDPMVLPLESAVADGATSVRLSGAGHLDLLFSARAYRAVHRALEPGAAEEIADPPEPPGGALGGARYDAASEEPT